MWWRRCKTAHTLATAFANRFVTLATSCKMLEVLIDNYNPLKVFKWRTNEQNKVIIVIKKFTYSVLCYCAKEPLKKIKLFCFL